MLTNNKFLVTGAAGFIGAALVERLIKSGNKVVGIDNLNNYYDRSLKFSRLEKLKKISKESSSHFEFKQLSIEDKDSLDLVFKSNKFDIVIHLAAQAGVRYSIENPYAYFQSNLLGFGNILEAIRNHSFVNNFLFASSSSVYGGNINLPFNECDSVDHPISLYAATKKANELMAHTYSHLYGIPSIGLRFFTVYGPWGRPDMAPMIFAKAILEKKPIRIFNNGYMSRDFTFIDDVIESIMRCCLKKAEIDTNFDKSNPLPSSSFAPYRIFNIGNSNPVKLMDFIETLESSLGLKAIKIFEELQPGDVVDTEADTSRIQNYIGYKPKTSLVEGVSSFVNWYKDYYGFST